jgi:Right handed beta helix region
MSFFLQPARRFPATIALAGMLLVKLTAQMPGGPAVTDYASIQEALDCNPGRMLFVPAGDYEISATIRLTTPDSGLWGPGRIIQINPEAAIITAQGIAGVQIRDLTLTRATGKQETFQSAIIARNCRNVVFENIQVRDNWSNSAALSVVDSPGAQIRGCLVKDYSRIAIDDRTATSFLGYAFTCIDGTGLSIRDTISATVTDNRVIESRLLPTPKLKARYQLGKYVKKNATRGWRTDPEAWETEYFNAWHQGSAIFVGDSEKTAQVKILNNYIENAAQGIDIHGDNVILANNVINNAFVGMKAMHGARNVLIAANQFSKNDLWSIGLMAGTMSHATGNPVEIGAGRMTRAEQNVDAGHIVTTNIISDFGYGLSGWIWPVVPNSRNSPILLGADGMAEQGRPPVRDVLLRANLLYDTGRDQILVDGKPQAAKPRYHYAVKAATGPDLSLNVHFAGNQFAPGLEGIANIELTP